MTTVSEVMTPAPMTIDAKQSIQQAAQLMEDLNVGALPVSDGDTVIGIVTDRDIAIRAVSSGMSPDMPIEDIASGPVDWCYGSDDIEDARARMESAQIRRIPVMDEDERLIGMLSLGDLAMYTDGNVASTLCAVSSPSAPAR